MIRCVLGQEGSVNSEYRWYFHDFNISAKTTKPPEAKDLKLARDELCRLANVSNKKEFYEQNLADDAKAIKKDCIDNNKQIELRSTKSYFSELLEKYASQLKIQDLVDIAKQIDEGI